MSDTHPIIASSERLQSHGALFFRQTSTAGRTFATQAAEAAKAFADELGAAGEQWVDTTSQSAAELGRGCQQEVARWRDLATARRDAYAEAFDSALQSVEERVSIVRESLRPAALQRTFLRTTHDALETAQERVEAQLAEASEEAESEANAKEAAESAPIRNYDQLTAKDVVSRIRRLSRPQATALLDYERSRKNRSTVVRAAERRVAAS